MTDPIKTLEALRLTPVDGGAVAWNNALEAAREAFEKNGMYGPFTPITVSGRSEPIDEADMRCAECDCESSNQPETTGNVPEVILDPRAYFEFTTKTVCVDACIAKQIEALWRAGVWTRGCCCGHNKCSPEVFLDRAADAKIAAEVLSRDPREWRLMVWAGDTHHKPARRALEGGQALAEAYRAGLEEAASICDKCDAKWDEFAVVGLEYAERIRASKVPPEFDRTTVSEFGGE